MAPKKTSTSLNYLEIFINRDNNISDHAQERR
jgi:hypothetical protein